MNQEIKNQNVSNSQQSIRITQGDFSDVFYPHWITEGADEKLVEFAKNAGTYMAKPLSRSKIRSIYGEIKRIQMKKFANERPAFYLLKPKVAYAVGRDPYNKGLQLFQAIFDKSAGFVKEENHYMNFCNLFEAILAYHRAAGGKD